MMVNAHDHKTPHIPASKRLVYSRLEMERGYSVPCTMLRARPGMRRAAARSRCLIPWIRFRAPGDGILAPRSHQRGQSGREN